MVTIAGLEEGLFPHRARRTTTPSWRKSGASATSRSRGAAAPGADVAPPTARVRRCASPPNLPGSSRKFLRRSSRTSSGPLHDRVRAIVVVPGARRIREGGYQRACGRRPSTAYADEDQSASAGLRPGRVSAIRSSASGWCCRSRQLEDDPQAASCDSRPSARRRCARVRETRDGRLRLPAGGLDRHDDHSGRPMT